MGLDLELTKKKYAKIREKYAEWIGKEYLGVRMYTDAYIFKKMEEEFYLKSRTIENIVYHRTNL